MYVLSYFNLHLETLCNEKVLKFYPVLFIRKFSKNFRMNILTSVYFLTGNYRRGSLLHCLWKACFWGCYEIGSDQCWPCCFANSRRNETISPYYLRKEKPMQFNPFLQEWVCGACIHKALWLLIQGNGIWLP